MTDANGNAIEPGAGCYFVREGGRYGVGVVSQIIGGKYGNVEVAYPVIGGTATQVVEAKDCTVLVSAQGTLVAWVNSASRSGDSQHGG